MDNVDDGAGWDAIAERVAIVDLLAVDKNRHVLAQFATIVQNVATRPLIRSKICVQYFTQRRAWDIARRACNVTLNVPGEPNGRHPEMIKQVAF